MTRIDPKTLTVAQRRARADELVPGLAGQARINWIQTGMNCKEQVAAQHAAAQETITNTKETSMTSTKKGTKKSGRTRKGQATKQTARTESRKAQASGFSAAEVARTAGIDGRAFRSWLRAEDIERRFASKAEASAAVKKFRRATS